MSKEFKEVSDKETRGGGRLPLGITVAPGGMGYKDGNFSSSESIQVSNAP